MLSYGNGFAAAAWSYVNDSGIGTQFVVTDFNGEGPKVIHWKGQYWLIADCWANGMRVWNSDDATNWKLQEQALFGHGERALSGSVTPPLSRPRLRSVAALPVKSHPHFVYKRFAAAESRFVTLMEVKLPPPVNTVRKVAVGVGWALSAERHALPQSSAEVSVCDSSAQARLSFPHLCASARDSGELELRSARKYFFIQRTHGA